MAQVTRLQMWDAVRLRWAYDEDAKEMGVDELYIPGQLYDVLNAKTHKVIGGLVYYPDSGFSTVCTNGQAEHGELDEVNGSLSDAVWHLYKTYLREQR